MNDEKVRALLRNILVYELDLENRDDGCIHFAGSVIMPRYHWNNILTLARELWFEESAWEVTHADTD